MKLKKYHSRSTQGSTLFCLLTLFKIRNIFKNKSKHQPNLVTVNSFLSDYILENAKNANKIHITKI